MRKTLIRLPLLIAVVGMAGCHFRFKSPDSFHAATTPNAAPRAGNTYVFDGYGFAGMADSTGGVASKTKFGAGAPGAFEGASEIYAQMDGDELRRRVALSSQPIFLVPDPEATSYTGWYLGSIYLDADGQITNLGPLYKRKP